MSDERSLPDEELHDLLHQLAEIRRQEDELFGKIYAHIEAYQIHEEVKRRMLKDLKEEKNDR